MFPSTASSRLSECMFVTLPMSFHDGLGFVLSDYRPSCRIETVEKN